MRRNKIVYIFSALITVLGVMLVTPGFTDKVSEAPEYTKENITLKFKNESGKKCYVEISGYSDSGCVTSIMSPWMDSINFPSAPKTEIPIDGEKSITIKDIVVTGKTANESRAYLPVFNIKVYPQDSNYADYHSAKKFKSGAKNSYTTGIFHITDSGETLFGEETLTIEFIQ